MSIAAMVASIKFNNRRSKREAFDGWTTSDKESQGIKIEPVSEEVLKQIRKKMKTQNRISTIKNVVVISISVMITVWLLLHLSSKI